MKHWYVLSLCTVVAIQYSIQISSVQAEHCEDNLKTMDNFRTIHDPKVGPLKDLQLLKVLYMMVSECLKRHSM